MDIAYSNNNIHKLYNKLPLQICHHLHIDLSHAFNNIDNLRRTKKKGPQARGYHTMEPAILRNVTIKTQAWSTLLYYAQSLIKELAKTLSGQTLCIHLCNGKCGATRFHHQNYIKPFYGVFREFW